MNCCDDFGNCTQGANCAARARMNLLNNGEQAHKHRLTQVHLHTRNGGAQVDTRHSEMPIVDLGDELFHADSCIGICMRAAIFTACFLAALALGSWWLRVPAWLWG